MEYCAYASRKISGHFKIKHVANGSIEKYEARFMARGFSQKEGADYEETFAPIIRYTP